MDKHKATLHAIKDYRPEPKQAVIDVLENYLERAKKGELRSVAVAGLLHDNTPIVAHADGSFAELVGVSQYLVSWLCNKMDIGADDPV